MNDASVLLVGLNRFLGVEIPDVDEFVIAGDDVGGCGRKLAVSNPVVMLFEGYLQSAVDGRPYFNELVVAAGGKEQAVAGEADTANTGIVGFDQGDFFGFGIEIDIPKFKRFITTCRN